MNLDEFLDPETREHIRNMMSPDPRDQAKHRNEHEAEYTAALRESIELTFGILDTINGHFTKYRANLAEEEAKSILNNTGDLDIEYLDLPKLRSVVMEELRLCFELNSTFLDTVTNNYGRAMAGALTPLLTYIDWMNPEIAQRTIVTLSMLTGIIIGDLTYQARPPQEQIHDRPRQG